MANGRGVRPTVCKRCGALALDGARISFRALCSDCSTRAIAEAANAMQSRNGPDFDRWRESMRRAADA